MPDIKEDGVKFEPVDHGIVYPFLRIYEEGGPFLKSYKIATRLVVVGRDKNVELRVQDKYISRKHFQIEFLGEGKLFLQDLGSANGTFLNGKRVERSKLEDGDEITVGEKRVIVSYKLSVPAKVSQKPQPSPQSPTLPDIRMKVDRHEKTEAEYEIGKGREKPGWEVPKHSIREALAEPERKPLKIVPKEKSFHDAPTRAEEVSDEMVSKGIERVLELASKKDRRTGIREEEAPVSERKLKVSTILTFFIIAIFALLIILMGWKFGGKYFADRVDLGTGDIANSRDAGKGRQKPVREMPLLPRPDAIQTLPPSPVRDVGTPEPDIMKDLARVEKPQVKTPDRRRQERQQEERIPIDIDNGIKVASRETKTLPDRTYPGRTAKNTVASPVLPREATSSQTRVERPAPAETPTPIPERIAEEPIQIPERTPSTQKRVPRIRPTVVAQTVRNLKEEEVLSVDLGKASRTLVASKESLGGKEATTTREINLSDINKLLDIDVNLSIMSEEIMISEQKDVNRFRQNLRNKITSVGTCYQDALKKDASVHGNTRINFIINKEGKVMRARVENSNVTDSYLNQCIIKRVRDTRFDEPPNDNFQISYTFKFKKSAIDFNK